MAKCPNCGAPMQGNSCPYCHYTEPVEQGNVTGNVVINNVYTQPQSTNVRYTQSISPKNKMVALLLCIFLGFLGAHRFYVGKIGTGVLYLFTYGLFGFGWIIDIILILCGSFKDSNNLPLKQ